MVITKTTSSKFIKVGIITGGFFSIANSLFGLIVSLFIALFGSFSDFFSGFILSFFFISYFLIPFFLIGNILAIFLLLKSTKNKSKYSTMLFNSMASIISFFVVQFVFFNIFKLLVESFI